ncbi:hypothetical protein L1987_02243 [Smallanthus sonchifolius]|uniref:Uncharacterized protein n=1 Tax=Smallanthus sonchifolius TaxID=185202 RepID=A0ACB9K7G1_9ASTR|nr:hypothetical protein L1987_02243 [Smallanthus sonchifolius]
MIREDANQQSRSTFENENTQIGHLLKKELKSHIGVQLFALWILAEFLAYNQAIGGTAGQLLEQNAQAFDQISANFAAFKLTYIYTHTDLSGRLAQNGLHPDCPHALPTPAQRTFETRKGSTASMSSNATSKIRRRRQQEKGKIRADR